MDREKVRITLFQILEKMIMNLKADHCDIVLDINKKQFGPLLTEVFGTDKEIVRNSEAMFFNDAGNNIVNACKTDGHSEEPEWFIKQARQKINAAKMIIHEKKKEMVRALENARALAMNGEHEDAQGILHDVFGLLEADLFDESDSVMKFDFDAARNAIRYIGFPTDNYDEEMKKTVQKIIDGAKEKSLALIAKLKEQLS